MNNISIRGRVLRTIIGHMSPGHFVGRRDVVEKPWKIPEEMNNEVITMPNFKMEFLSPKNNPRQDFVILQLHGGGYVGNMNNSHRTMAYWYHQASQGLSVLTIDYQIAPEHPFPAALEDALDAIFWLNEKGFKTNQVIVVGDSSGGGLALGLGMYLKDHKMDLPRGYVLMSPWTDLTASGISYKTNFQKDPLLGRGRPNTLYQSAYLGDHNDPKNPYISPLFGDYLGFPPMLIQVGSNEMLLSDSEGVAEKAKKSGVKVRLSVYEGMFHVFQKARPILPESMKAWNEIKQYFVKIEDEVTKV